MTTVNLNINSENNLVAGNNLTQGYYQLVAAENATNVGSIYLRSGGSETLINIKTLCSRDPKATDTYRRVKEINISVVVV